MRIIDKCGYESAMDYKYLISQRIEAVLDGNARGYTVARRKFAQSINSPYRRKSVCKVIPEINNSPCRTENTVNQ